MQEKKRLRKNTLPSDVVRERGGRGGNCYATPLTIPGACYNFVVKTRYVIDVMTSFHNVYRRYMIDVMIEQLTCQDCYCGNDVLHSYGERLCDDDANKSRIRSPVLP